MFILYTKDCVSTFDSVRLLKYADDTVILGLIHESEEEYRSAVKSFSYWCKDNFLELNPNKTKEIVFDFRVKKETNPGDHPICVNGENIEIVESYKYLGTIIDHKLDWSEHTEYLFKKANQRLHFLLVLKSFRVDRTIMTLFYSSVIESVITHDCVVWYNGAKKKDKNALKKVVKQASRLIGQHIDLDQVCEARIVKKADSVLFNQRYPLHKNYVLMRSGKRWQSVSAKTTRFLNSFVPSSIRLLNTSS